MKLMELYALSLIEPFDVIEALDPEQAEIIKKANSYNALKKELSDAGISAKLLGKMRTIKNNFDQGGGIQSAMNRMKNNSL